VKLCLYLTMMWSAVEV